MRHRLFPWTLSAKSGQSVAARLVSQPCASATAVLLFWYACFRGAPNESSELDWKWSGSSLRQWAFLRGVAARLVMRGLLAGFAVGTARVRVSHRGRAASSGSLDAECQVTPECSTWRSVRTVLLLRLLVSPGLRVSAVRLLP